MRMPIKTQEQIYLNSILQSPESTISSTSRQNMPTITAHIANNRLPVFCSLPERSEELLMVTAISDKVLTGKLYLFVTESKYGGEILLVYFVLMLRLSLTI